MQLVARELDLDPKRYPAARAGRPGVQPEERAGRPGGVHGARRTGPHERAVAEAYTLYQRRLREAHALDFDDLIMATVHLLQSHPHVAENYRRRFRHVLVDEYQDTNHAQYTLVKELVGAPGGDVEPGELCVVGDADQSIYAFRGATIRNILEFERDYPDARTILLEQNYRSTQTILSAANAVIDRNTVAQAEAAVERPGRRRADRRLRRRHRARRGRLGGPRDRPALRRPTRSAPATWPSSTAPTPSPGCSRRCSSGSACRTRWSAGCASTSARRSATRWPTCARWSTTTTR